MPSTLQRLKRSLTLRNMAATDRQVLIFCMVLAFVFWLILNLSQEYVINKEVKLDYTAGPDRVIAGSPPRSVPIQLRGRGWNLIWESLGSSTVDVTVELGNAKDLLLSSNLLEQQIRRRLSSGELRVENMGYESQRVLTTPRDGKRVPVVSNLRVNFQPGYFAPAGLRLTPDSITVSGAADVLEEIDSWPTLDTQIEGVGENTTFSVTLQPPPEGITLNYTTVTASMIVEAFIEQQLRIPVVLHDAPPADSFRIFPPYVTVTATIPQREYGRYNSTDFRVEADLSKLATVTEQNTLPLTLTRVPESIKSVTFSPRAVEYYVYREPAAN